ncbi:MAG: ribosomal-processing cysteine protease Prp [Vallitaleaceae bacterium]|nr:ribosomal-processing cysteine protease Prp [Vallitaleaceae bacterium]
MEQIKQITFAGFEISGHAGYAEYGQDLVCSSVSVLGISTANALSSFTDAEPYVEMKESGYLKVTLGDASSEQGQLLLKAFVLGIESILENYGETYIHIIYKEV